MKRWIRHPIRSFKYWRLKSWLTKEMHRDLMHEQNKAILYGETKTRCPHGEPHYIEIVEKEGPSGIATASGSSPPGAP